MLRRNIFSIFALQLIWKNKKLHLQLYSMESIGEAFSFGSEMTERLEMIFLSKYFGLNSYTSN